MNDRRGCKQASQCGEARPFIGCRLLNEIWCRYIWCTVETLQYRLIHSLLDIAQPTSLCTSEMQAHRYLKCHNYSQPICFIQFCFFFFLTVVRAISHKSRGCCQSLDRRVASHNVLMFPKSGIPETRLWWQYGKFSVLLGLYPFIGGQTESFCCPRYKEDIQLIVDWEMGF